MHPCTCQVDQATLMSGTSWTGVRTLVSRDVGWACRYTTEDSMVKVASVIVQTPYCGANVYDNKITAYFNFSETQISVRCVDETTGKEQQTQLNFDSSEVLRDAGFRVA